MILRTLQPKTIKKAIRLYYMRLEGKTATQIERETGEYYSNVYTYANYIKRHPELLEQYGKEGEKHE